MKKKLLYIVLFIFLIGSFACKKEFDYPLIQTGEVTDIDSTGAVFHAKIIDIGNVGIYEYGFVWGRSPELSINSSNITFGNINQIGVFSCIITNDLLKNTRYYVRAFAKNQEYIVFGQTVSFESIGSIAPSIIDFLPKNGSEGDVVTIYGDNFSASIHNNLVYFGDIIVEIDSASQNKLVVTLPGNIVRSGFVEIKCIVSNQEVVADEKFKMDGVTIYNFYPKELYGSDTIYIECKDLSLNLNENIVKIGNRELELISLTGNTLAGLIYYNEYPGEKLISVSANGKICRSIETLTVLNTWETIISDYPFIRGRIGHVSFSIYEKAYIGTGVQGSNEYNDLWAYNSNTNIWEQCSDLPTEWSGIQNLVGFSIGEKGYVGLGHIWGNYFYNEMYEYNPNEDTWTQKSDFPGEPRRYALGIALEDYGYVGLGGSPGSEMKRDFWKYDSENDSWTQLNDFPEMIYAFDIHGVQINKGYIAIEEYYSKYIISLWEYNPDSDSWIQLPNVPIPYDSNLSVVFASNNYLIFGFDRYGTREFWKYHIETNTFLRIADNPGEPENPRCFKVNGKTYMTSSDQNSSYHFEELYIFNPDW